MAVIIVKDENGRDTSIKSEHISAITAVTPKSFEVFEPYLILNVYGKEYVFVGDKRLFTDMIRCGSNSWQL